MKMYMTCALSTLVSFSAVADIETVDDQTLVANTSTLAANKLSQMALAERARLEIAAGPTPVQQTANYLSSHFANGLPFSKSDYARQFSAAVEKVKIEIPSVAEGEFNGEFSRTKFTLLEAADFIQFLDVNNIKHSDQIADAFLKGVASDSTCQGLRSECVIYTKSFSIVIDYYQQRVRLFISPEWVGRRKENNEYLEIEGSNIATNKISLFYNDNSLGKDLTISNKGYTGFGDGFFHHDFDIKNEAGSTINDLNYTWLSANNKVQVGRLKNGAYFNYAYGKSHLANDLFQGIIMGTSEQLSLSKSDNALTFFSPVPAIVTVVSANQEVLKRYVNAGIGSISYSDLPRGIYQADVLIKADDGTLIHTIPSFIVNDGSQFAAGFEVYAQYGVATEELLPTYGVGASLPVAENVVAYSSLQAVDKDEFFSVGAEYRKDGLSLSATLIDSDQRREQELTLLWLAFSINYSQSKSKGAEKTAGSKEWQEGLEWEQEQEVERSRSLRLSYNHQVGDNSVLGYSYTNTRSSYGNSESYGISLSTPIWENIYLSSNLERRNEEDYISLSISIPLGGKTTLTTMSNYNGKKWSSKATGQYNKNYSDMLSYNLGATLGQNGEQSLSGGLNYGGSGASISSRAYLSGTQGNSYGVQLDSIQIFSNNGFEFQNPYKEGGYDSFITLDKTLAKDVSVSIKRSGDNSYQFIDHDDGILGVDSYDRYSVNAKVSSGEFVFENASEKFKKDVDLIPGKALHITSSLNRVIENIVMTDTEQTGVTCQGEGCVAVENIQDSLYRLKMFSSGDVNLMTSKGYCNTITEQDREMNRGNLTRVVCERE
ncbi:MAG: hypothetical protein RR721_08505 [Aeromonas sp.]|uniref:hypothetical protein n=1 Tax=Aeromonas sp. TaxID=647 RepID=UPI002FC93277